MEQSRYWLFFDPGIHGNYQELYEWLDTLGGKERGDSVATFLSIESREEIASELAQLPGSDMKARAYPISMRQWGRYILGRRKAAPWAGSSPQPIEAEEER